MFSRRLLLPILLILALLAPWATQARADQGKGSAERGSIPHEVEIRQTAEALRMSGAAQKQEASARRDLGHDVVEMRRILQAIVVKGVLSQDSSKQVGELETCTDHIASHVDALESDKTPPAAATVATLQQRIRRLRKQVAAIRAASDGKARMALAQSLLKEAGKPKAPYDPTFYHVRVTSSGSSSSASSSTRPLPDAQRTQP